MGERGGRTVEAEASRDGVTSHMLEIASSSSVTISLWSSFSAIRRNRIQDWRDYAMGGRQAIPIKELD